MHIRHHFIVAVSFTCAGIFGTAGNVRGDIIGPGNVNASVLDVTFPSLIAVDLLHTATLGAGTYAAASFNYQFFSIPGFSDAIHPSGGVPVAVGGSVTPIVLIGSGGSFTPVAMGNSVTYAGGTPFISTPFGGSSQFTLGSTTTVYAGFFWNGGELFNGNPIEYDPSSGSSFVRSSGAFSPVIGTPISGGIPGTFIRSYDFSITINQAAVPSPTSLALGVIGLAPALLRRRRAMWACSGL